MVQGGKKISNVRPGQLKKASTNNAKVVKKIKNAQKVRKGAPVQLPKGKFRDDALDDRALSRAIDKASEQKVASKVIQDGGKIKLNDVLQKGKEMNRDLKRKLLKKKVGRVEEKLKQLEQKAEQQGLA
jgi:hypothetical protein